MRLRAVAQTRATTRVAPTSGLDPTCALVGDNLSESCGLKAKGATPMGVAPFAFVDHIVSAYNGFSSIASWPSCVYSVLSYHTTHYAAIPRLQRESRHLPVCNRHDTSRV